MVFGNDKFEVPTGLQTEDFVIRPLLATDVELDYEAVMGSREELRKWEQAPWPADDFTVAENLKDLERHEQEHIDREAYTYTVMNPTETECLGCIYIMPRAKRRWLSKAEAEPMGNEAWTDYESIIQFWVTEPQRKQGMDRKLLDALLPWFENEWDFDGYLLFVNEEYAQQVTLFEEANLQLRFKVRLPGNKMLNRAYN